MFLEVDDVDLIVINWLQRLHITSSTTSVTQKTT